MTSSTELAEQLGIASNTVQQLIEQLIVYNITVESFQDQRYRTPLQTKWPNDLICNNKKLAGILIEIYAATKTSCTVIIGIGVNVNMLPATTTTIDQPWTSLYAEQQQPYNRNELSAAIINTTHDYLKRFCDRGLAEFLPEWHTQDYLFDQDISLQSNAAEFNGTGAGIDAAGQLLLTLADGTTHTVAAGEITAKMR